MRVGLGGQDRQGIQSIKIWALQLSRGRQRPEGPGVGRQGGLTAKGDPGLAPQIPGPPRACLRRKEQVPAASRGFWVWRTHDETDTQITNCFVSRQV